MVEVLHKQNLENFGIEHNNLNGKNCPERKRTTTDVICLIIYCLIIAIWIGIAIYAYSNSEVSPIKAIVLTLEILWNGVFTFGPTTLIFSWFCILLVVCYFIMLRWCTKFTVYLSIFLEFLFLTLGLIAVSFKLHFAVVLPVFLVFYLIFWIEIQILRETEIHTVCKIIVEAYKAAIAFPSSLMIVLLCLLTTLLLCTIFATVFYCLVNAKPVVILEPVTHTNFWSDNQVYQKVLRYTHNTGLVIAFSIISGWILLVNSLCMLSTLHGMFTTWCRTANKSTIPRFTILLRHLFYAYRYHIGSFAFMAIPIASIIQIIRTICANIHKIETKLKENLCNIYCLLVIILNIITNSNVACVSYGKCFYPSMKDAFKLLIENPMKFAAVRMVITNMIFFGIILIPGIMIGLAALYESIWGCIYYGLYLEAIIGSVSIFITSGALFILSAAVDSVLFCHLEELHNN